MNKKTYKNWKSLTDKMLEDSWKFRNLCGRPFDRGFIGELLVIKQLLETYEADICSLLENNLIYAGSSNKGWDIELMLNGKFIFLNAKATTELHDSKPRWVRQQAKVFCDIKINQKNLRQHISLKTDFDSNLFYVFVDVGTWLKNHKANYYILSDKEAKSKLGRKYRNGRNRDEKKEKIRKTGSTDFWVEYKDVKNFKDKYLKSIKSYFLK